MTDLIAAIDLLDGRAARLSQGDYARPSAVTAEPIELAAAWVAEGVRRLHLVDLDGALLGRPAHGELIGRIARAARARTRVRIEAGGGLRDLRAVEETLAAGIDDAVLGTAAFERPGFLATCATRWPGRIVASIDIVDGRLAVDGWRRRSGGDPVEVAARLIGEGAAGLIVTDPTRDGTLSGPNLELLERFRRAFPEIPLAAAGGVGTLEDLRCLRAVGVDAVVVGLALLSGALPLGYALAELGRTETAPVGATQ